MEVVGADVVPTATGAVGTGINVGINEGLAVGTLLGVRVGL